MRSIGVLLLILVGFVAWAVLAVEVISWLDRPHWLVEFALFAVAGVTWAWPAAWMMRRVMAASAVPDTEASSNGHRPDARQP